MKSLRFAQLNWIEHERYVPMLRKPTRIGLVGRIDFPLGMPAQIEHGRQRLVDDCGTVQIADDIGTGQALEMHFLHDVIAALKRPGHGGLQRSARGQRRQAKHF